MFKIDVKDGDFSVQSVRFGYQVSMTLTSSSLQKTYFKFETEEMKGWNTYKNPFCLIVKIREMGMINDESRVVNVSLCKSSLYLGYAYAYA